MSADDEPRRQRRIVRNTAIFSIATGLSRIAGLIREIVASSYFGTRVEASAFTIAFQIPNLLRSLVADAALSAAFVPVFTELLEKGKKKEAYQLAGAMFGLILAVLGGITLLAGDVPVQHARPGRSGSRRAVQILGPVSEGVS